MKKEWVTVVILGKYVFLLMLGLRIAKLPANTAYPPSPFSQGKSQYRFGDICQPIIPKS